MAAHSTKGKIMADATISLEDRQEIYDVLARYVWSMDTGDIEGVVATFTPDGVVKDVTGKSWDASAGGVRGFATQFLTRPNRRGGQHHVQHLFVEHAEGGRLPHHLVLGFHPMGRRGRPEIHPRHGQL
ncbi:MAG TPA: nuclear transport factor 2 family protein [Candidatus Tectomicrobia bacterium]|nr:nuclear transport factor 2 family protein [Candidatus Tectomicrobia bacterium]